MRRFRRCGLSSLPAPGCEDFERFVVRSLFRGGERDFLRRFFDVGSNSTDVSSTGLARDIGDSISPLVSSVGLDSGIGQSISPLVSSVGLESAIGKTCRSWLEVEMK